MEDGLKEFYGNYATEEETARTIRKFYEENQYVLDTHTAVAAEVYEKYLVETGDEKPAVIASTASPYKFTRSVLTAIDPKYGDMDDFTLAEELEKLSGVKIPKAIEEIRTAPVRHNTVAEAADMPQVVKKILKIQ